MKLETPLAKVKGLGSAGEGVGHWWHQRLTAIALLPLIGWMLFAANSLLGAPHAEVVAFLSSPVHASLGLILILALAYHMQLGLQVVVEDYIHNRPVEITLLLLIKAAALVFAVLGSLALLKIAL